MVRGGWAPCGKVGPPAFHCWDAGRIAESVPLHSICGTGGCRCGCSRSVVLLFFGLLSERITKVCVWLCWLLLISIIPSSVVLPSALGIFIQHCGGWFHSKVCVVVIFVWLLNECTASIGV